MIEKGRVAGAHQLSGGVMNPSAIRTLLPDDDSPTHYGEVDKETVYFCLNCKRAIPLKTDAPALPQPRQHVVERRRAEPLARQKAGRSAPTSSPRPRATSCWS